MGTLARRANERELPYGASFHGGSAYLKLSKMHRILRERGLVPVPPNYQEAIRIMASKVQPTDDSAVQA